MQMGTLISIGWVCGGAMLATGSLAQPKADPPGTSAISSDDVASLREENRKLREEMAGLRQVIADSRTELSQLHGQLTALIGQLADLKGMLKQLVSRPAIATPGSPGTPASAKAEVPKDPMACPTSLLAELKRKYEADFHEPAAETDAGRKQRLTEVQRWCREMPRALRGRVRWLVRLVEAGNEEPGKETVRYQVLDAMTRVPLGDEVVSPLPLALVVKVRALPVGSLIEVGATMEAEPTFNAARGGTSVFDYPPLLGPFAESGVKVEWQSVEPIKDSARPTPDRSNPR